MPVSRRNFTRPEFGKISARTKQELRRVKKPAKRHVCGIAVSRLSSVWSAGFKFDLLTYQTRWGLTILCSEWAENWYETKVLNYRVSLSSFDLLLFDNRPLRGMFITSLRSCYRGSTCVFDLSVYVIFKISYLCFRILSLDSLCSIWFSVLPGFWCSKLLSFFLLIIINLFFSYGRSQSLLFGEVAR